MLQFYFNIVYSLRLIYFQSYSLQSFNGSLNTKVVHTHCNFRSYSQILQTWRCLLKQSRVSPWAC